MRLLQLFLAALLRVLGQSFLDGLLQRVDGVAAGVAHAHFGGLALTLALLGQLLASLLRQWGDADADNLAVVLRHDAQRGVDNGLLDDAEHALVPRLDGDAARVRGGDGSHIIDGHHRSVGVYADAIQQAYVCLTGADVCQCFFQVHDSHVHLLLGFAQDFFYIFHIVVAFMVRIRFFLGQAKIGHFFEIPVLAGDFFCAGRQNGVRTGLSSAWLGCP